jgi:HAD superfamily hydrolase (TIGR01490 family)
VKTAAIFDVDGTICATRSSTSLIWLRERQHPAWRHRLWLASLAWRAPMVMLIDKFSRARADRIVYRQYAGLSEERLRRDGRDCCDALLRPSCFADALAEIEMHRAAGRRILLLSGGIDLVLAPFAEHLGADLLAQRLEAKNGRFTGGFLSYEGTEHAASQGERKAAALRRFAERHGIDLAGSYAYGDSVNDAGMMAEVGHAVAVNPDSRLRKKAEQRGWSIRNWR